MTVAVVALTFQVGARTLASIERRLERVAWSLADVHAARPVALPVLDAADGYLLTSVPQVLIDDVTPPRLIAVTRQRYTRHFVDLSASYDDWSAALAGRNRAALRRKARKVAALGNGRLDVRSYRTAAEFAQFHPIARTLSARTYQERLLAAGLPAAAAEIAALHDLAAADRLRAWLLFVAGRPAAYLCCTATGDTLRYDYLGHDPALASLSPGTVLQDVAMRDLFADRFAWLDFTEGEGQHKRLFASGGIACVDILLLRPNWRNRLVAAALTGFDVVVGAGKRRLHAPALARVAALLRR